MAKGGPWVTRMSKLSGIDAQSLCRSSGHDLPNAPPYEGVTGEPQILRPSISIPESIRRVAFVITLRSFGSSSR